MFAAVGCGGSGCNMAERLSTLSDVDIITVNTDHRSLVRSRSGERILIGNVEGCSGNVKKGRSCAMKARKVIREKLRPYSDVIIMTGLGGGTGTGGLPVIAKMAEKNGSNVISVVTLPLSFEKERMEVSKNAVKTIRKFSDSLIVLDGSRIETIDPGLSVDETLRALNEMVCVSVIRMMSMSWKEKGMFTVGVAEHTEPTESAMISYENLMFDHSATIPGGTILYLEGILRSTDRDDVKEVCASIGLEPQMVCERTGSKKAVTVMFTPVSDLIFG